MSKAKSSGPRPSKRALILKAARELFLEAGLEATSMDQITAAAGISKATLYNHFENKDALFAEVMAEKYEALAEELGELDESVPPEEALADFGRRLITLVTSPEHIHMVRVIVGATGSNPAISEAYFRHGKAAAFRALGTYLERRVADGTFVIDDVYLAGMQFLGAIKEPLLWPRVFGGNPRGEVDDVVRRAVRMAVKEWTTR
ncbi:TetR/AcrR family transcriptional regulator [Parvularcula marina]|uniref:TetR/AcrR family transcriptional regulator n=1 Tax=Parvularcula marina TaxID=2292771 RepID=UPI00351375E6